MGRWIACVAVAATQAEREEPGHGSAFIPRSRSIDVTTEIDCDEATGPAWPLAIPMGIATLRPASCAKDSAVHAAQTPAHAAQTAARARRRSTSA